MRECVICELFSLCNSEKSGLDFRACTIPLSSSLT